MSIDISAMSIKERFSDFKKRFSEAYGYHEAREASIPFYKRLVEDLTYWNVEEVTYDRKKESFRFIFRGAYAEDLYVNAFWSSLAACTSDVIYQTEEYIERMRGRNPLENAGTVR